MSVQRARPVRSGGLSGFTWEYDPYEERDAANQEVSATLFPVAVMSDRKSYVGTRMGYVQVYNLNDSGVVAAVYKVDEELLGQRGKRAVRCGPVEYIPSQVNARLLFAKKAYSAVPGRTLYVYWYTLPPMTEQKQFSGLWRSLQDSLASVETARFPRVRDSAQQSANHWAVQLIRLAALFLPKTIVAPGEVNTPARRKLKIQADDSGLYTHSGIVNLIGASTLIPRAAGHHESVRPAYDVTSWGPSGCGGIRVGGKSTAPQYSVKLQTSVWGTRDLYHGALSPRLKDIIRSSLSEYDILSWKRDEKTATVKIHVKRKESMMDRKMNSSNQEKANIQDQFGDSAVDGWMEGDIRIHSNGKRELGLKVLSIHGTSSSTRSGGGRHMTQQEQKIGWILEGAFHDHKFWTKERLTTLYKDLGIRAPTFGDVYNDLGLEYVKYLRQFWSLDPKSWQKNVEGKDVTQLYYDLEKLGLKVEDRRGDERVQAMGTATEQVAHNRWINPGCLGRFRIHSKPDVSQEDAGAYGLVQHACLKGTKDCNFVVKLVPIEERRGEYRGTDPTVKGFQTESKIATLMGQDGIGPKILHSSICWTTSTGDPNEFPQKTGLLVMDKWDMSLTQYFQDHPRQFVQHVDVIQKTFAEKLKTMHSLGYAHGDIHGGNLMLKVDRKTGRPVDYALIDFGLARVSDEKYPDRDFKDLQSTFDDLPRRAHPSSPPADEKSPADERRSPTHRSSKKKKPKSSRRKRSRSTKKPSRRKGGHSSNTLAAKCSGGRQCRHMTQGFMSSRLLRSPHEFETKRGGDDRQPTATIVADWVARRVYSNNAWGRQRSAKWISKDGNIYEYDIPSSMVKREMGDPELDFRAYKLGFSKWFGRVPHDLWVNQILPLIAQLRTPFDSSRWIITGTGRDGGRRVLSVQTPNGIIVLKEQGDQPGYLNTPEAEQLALWLERAIESVE